MPDTTSTAKQPDKPHSVSDQTVQSAPIHKPEYQAPLAASHTISDLSEPDGLNDLHTEAFTISDIEIEPDEIAHDSHTDYADAYVDRWASATLAAWVVLIALGVAALLLQLAFVFRVQIAEAVPAARPRLERMCSLVGCNVSWARKPDLIAIVASSLQSDPGQQAENNESHMILQATLRNSYAKPQEWPALVLDLTDAAGKKMATRNIVAQEYLLPETAGQPFPANSEHNIKLPLTLHGLKVNGYQLTIFFP